MIKVYFSEANGSNTAFEQQEVFYETFNPRRKVPRNASLVHGIRDRDVRTSPSFAERSNIIRDFIGHLPMFAHNADFDI